MILVEDYPIVLDCWRSGQISDADMVKIMEDDPLFRVWMERASKETINDETD